MKCDQYHKYSIYNLKDNIVVCLNKIIINEGSFIL